MKPHLAYFLIGTLLILIFPQQRLYAQAQRPYDKSFIQAEINRYKAYLQRTPAGITSTTNIDVKYYRLNLGITTSPQYLKGNVLLNAVSTLNSLNTISLDLMNSMTIDSVKVGGTSTSFTQLPSTFSVTLDRTYNSGELMSVEIFYRGRPGSSGFGSFEFSSHSSTPWIWSLSEPYGAKDWWPCNDHPSDKADSADIFITCDAAFKVGSNGKLRSIIDNGNGTHTYHWHEGYPISTYLVSVAITNYAQFSNWFKYTSTDSMEILNYVLPEHLASAQSQLPLVVEQLRIYSNLFGLYPFINEKYGHSEFGWGGGMEHQTMTSLGGFSEGLTAHELAHQWFGDMITCRTWPDIWLNEGFATYCENLYEGEKYGEGYYRGGILSNMTDAKNATASLYVNDSSSVGSLFSWNRVYAKGSVVLHMLRHVLGDSTFFRSMYNYANDSRYRFGTASTEDFRGVCESTSGKSLGYFFNEWVYGKGYPSYTYSWNAESTAHGYMVHLSLNQPTGLTNPTFFTMPIDFKATAGGWDTTVTLFNDSLTQTFLFEVSRLPTGLALDPGNWILKNVVEALTGNMMIDSVVTLKLLDDYLQVQLWLRNAGSSTISADLRALLKTTNPMVKSVVMNNAIVGPLAPGQRNPIPVVAGIYVDKSVKWTDIPMTVDISSNSIVYWSLGLTARVRSLSVENGWNMLSVPMELENYANTVLFTGSSSKAFSYRETYQQEDTLLPGVGYWLKYGSGQSLNIPGTDLDVDTIMVRSGWNMIGSVTFPIPVSLISSIPSGITTTKFYHYESGLNYISTDTIQPGYGYWVKTNQDGELILASSESPLSKGSRINIISDSELPPPPPEGEISNLKPQIPNQFVLEQNYPNPFNPTTEIRYAIREAGFVTLKIYDVLGREVATLVEEMKQPGHFTMTWDAANRPTGMYFIQLQAGSYSETKKLVLMR